MTSKKRTKLQWKVSNF